tara:strand:- start:1078 stop:2025 length:948 start_codon:yes stop_codon:yes gene_type:complete
MKENSNFEVTIIGVGNIGLRYYQAILEINCVRKINLIEKKIQNIEERISSINPFNKEINITDSISNQLLKSDLIIISTTSYERYEICKKLQYLGYKGKLILEKFLFPNEKILSNAEILFDLYPSNIYVNQWMRKTNLKKIINLVAPVDIEVMGDNLGLLCNSVHFIDLICETYKSKIFEIDLNFSYIDRIFKSKRSGYIEMCGKLSWKDKENSITFSIEDRAIEGSNKDIYFKINNQSATTKYLYSDRELKNLNSGFIDYIPYLSEHAKDTVNSILHGKNPGIPKFKDSVKHHYLVFEALSKILSKKDYELIQIT